MVGRICKHFEPVLFASLLLLLLMMIVGISGCSSTGPVQAPERVGAVRNLSNNDLMSIYGTALRSDFREQFDSISKNGVLSEVEREAEQRSLINNESVGEIERGLIYLDMPVHQIFASIDGLDVVEHADFEQFVVSMYQGNKGVKATDVLQGALSAAGLFYGAAGVSANILDSTTGKKHRETVLICKNKVGGAPKIIGYEVLGTYTSEYFSVGNRRFRKIITNYEPGHFDKDSPESMKYYKNGQRRPEEPDKATQEAAGRNRSLMLAVTKNKGPDRLQAYFDKETTSGRYPSLLRYLESVC